MNLWPDELKNQHSPLTYMYKASDALDDKYHLQLRGIKANEHDKAVTKFIIVGGGTSLELLQVDDPLDYPCKIHFDGAIIRCRTEAELIGRLAWVFNHAKTKAVIADLMKGGDL